MNLLCKFMYPISDSSQYFVYNSDSFESLLFVKIENENDVNFNSLNKYSPHNAILFGFIEARKKNGTGLNEDGVISLTYLKLCVEFIAKYQ